MSDKEIDSRQTEVGSDLTELESGHVFRMHSIHDIFRKLHREKQRFERTGSNSGGLADQMDAAINFIITAWHMTDWAWVQHEHRLREYFGTNSCREFQDEMRRRCPGLAVCDVIANAAKHGGVAYGREDRPEIETVLIAHPAAEGVVGAELIALPAQRGWSLAIESDGRRQDPLVMFNRIFVFWHKFIQKHCVGKPG